MRIRIAVIAVLLSLGICLSGCSRFAPAAPNAQGPKIVLQVDPKPGDEWPSSATERSAALDKVKNTLAERTRALAQSGPVEVTREGEDKLVVQLPRKMTEAELKQLTTKGSLEFYYMKDIQNQVNPLGKWKMDVSGEDTRSYTFTGPNGQTLSTANRSDVPKIMSQVVGAPTVKPVLTGADLKSNAKSALRPNNGQPMIEIEFTSQGAQAFSDFTAGHVKEILGVFYNGELLTAPKINERISDGKAIIEGFKTLRQATEVASSINSGALPVHLKLVSAPKPYWTIPRE